ncbi:MAG: hypothetical protein ACK5TR_09000 [Alphaproteobacteria bacterium]
MSLVFFDDNYFLPSDPNKEIFKSWFYTGLTEVLRTFALTQNLKGYVSVNTPEAYVECVNYEAFAFEQSFELPLPRENSAFYFGFLMFEGSDHLSKCQ